MSLFKGIATAIVALWISACSVQSSQLNALVSIFKSPASALDNSSWVLHYGDYQAQVYAVAVAEGTLFSNSQGDQALFDGWAFKEVKGAGLPRGRWLITDKGASRELDRRGKPTSIHSCNAWSKANSASIIASSQIAPAKNGQLEAIYFIQDCIGKTAYQNKITVNKAGEIELIAQIIDGTEKPFVLRKSL